MSDTTTNNDATMQDDDTASSGAQDQRPRGRPKSNNRPTVPWHEVDHLLVFGESVEDGSLGPETIRYPTYREVAERYGVSASLIGRYAKDRQCIKRRQEAQAREQTQYEQHFTDKRAEARATAAVNAVELIDEYIAHFYAALDQGRVRTDSVTDFNTMVRLRAFLTGHADSREEIRTTITLEEIQERHAALRAKLDDLDPVITGEEVPPALPERPAVSSDAARRLDRGSGAMYAAAADDGDDWEDRPPRRKSHQHTDGRVVTLETCPQTDGRRTEGLRIIDTRIGRGWEDDEPPRRRDR